MMDICVPFYSISFSFLLANPQSEACDTLGLMGCHYSPMANKTRHTDGQTGACLPSNATSQCASTAERTDHVHHPLHHPSAEGPDRIIGRTDVHQGLLCLSSVGVHMLLLLLPDTLC